jgi:multidrug resistance efflux pump
MRYIRNAFIPVLAIAAFSFAVVNVVRGQRTLPPPEPPIPPATSPFSDTVAGSGIAEPRTENIAIGTALPGLVEEVSVKVGDKVHAGDLILKIDDRQLRANLTVQEANLASAEAQLQKLENMPRPEELPASEAKVRQAKANLAQAEDQLARVRKLIAVKAMTQEDLVTRDQAYETAKQQLAEAIANDNLLRAGAWEPDKQIARAAVQQARAQVEQVRTDLERLNVRASVDGEVLQVNVRPGEFVAAPHNQALIILGDVHCLHVRVDIDEHDIPRFRPGAAARATVRGDQEHSYTLHFVRVEPYVIPKKSLTGDNTERVDTRVLQVIYAFEPCADTDRPVYVGQQLDVFIDLKSVTSG